MKSYSTLSNGITHEECEFGDDVIICNNDIREENLCELCCQDILSHVNSKCEPVNRILPDGLSVIIEGGDTFSIITDFKMYKISPRVDIRVVENPRFRVLGAIMQSYKISDGDIILSFINNSPHRVILNYKKVVAIVYVTGNYKFIRCNNDFSENSEIGKWGVKSIKQS